MRLPIFQLRWHYHNNTLGLIFPSESKDDTQNFVFALPLIYQHRDDIRRNIDQLHEQLIANQYYLPSQINGRYTEINAKVTLDLRDLNPTLSFPLSKGQDIYFRINVGTKELTNDNLNGAITPFSYIGSSKPAIFRKFNFLTLEPLNQSLIAQAFQDEEAILVGYTPSYGEFPFSEFPKN